MSRSLTSELHDVRSGSAELLRKLLVGLLVLLLIATVLSVVIEGRVALTIEELALNLMIGAVILIGLWLLRQGHLKSVVWLVTAGLMLAAVQGLAVGIEGHASRLLIFIAPITLVGLVLGRWALYFTAGVSVAFVLAIHALEQSNSAWLPEMRDPTSPLARVVIFSIVVGLLVIFLDRFALTLQDSLAVSAVRERELLREMAERQRLESRLQLATEAGNIGLWSWDPDTNEVEWSSQLKELFGLPLDASITQETFLERVHPEDHARVLGQFDDLGNLGGDPYRVVLPGGETRWLVGFGKSITLPDEKRLALGAAYEVTALVEAEEERVRLLDKEQEARREAERYGERLAFLAEAGHILGETLSYRDTLAKLAELVVPQMADWCAIDVLNEDEHLERVVVVHSNPEMVQFAYDIQRQYPADPEAETGSYQVVRSGKPNLFSEVSDELLASAARDEKHLEMLRRVGFSSAIQAPLMSRGKPMGVLTLVQAESGRHYDNRDLELAMQLAGRSAVAVDNARLYDEARELNAELEERVVARTEELLSANSELESFTYSASHDLRAPLRGINGFSQALLEDYGDRLDETGREYLQRIHAGAVRMGELIDDLLDLSRISRAEFRLERIDLSNLTRSVIENLQANDRDRVVDVRVEDGLEACADPRLILIALENLLGNAWKFTGEHEQALIEVGRNEKGEFFVRDNGAGFDMQYANKLFVPFQRLHPADSYGGTGIGLATSKRIVERLGGELWGEGEEGKGATFYFTLPPAEVANC